MTFRDLGSGLDLFKVFNRLKYTLPKRCYNFLCQNVLCMQMSCLLGQSCLLKFMNFSFIVIIYKNVQHDCRKELFHFCNFRFEGIYTYEHALNFPQTCHQKEELIHD